MNLDIYPSSDSLHFCTFGLFQTRWPSLPKPERDESHPLSEALRKFGGAEGRGRDPVELGQRASRSRPWRKKWPSIRATFVHSLQTLIKDGETFSIKNKRRALRASWGGLMLPASGTFLHIYIYPTDSVCTVLCRESLDSELLRYVCQHIYIYIR